MASTSETGHAKNVTNFEILITSIIAYGDLYNPSRESIKLSALQTLQTAAQESIGAVNMAQSLYSNAVAAREVAFDPFSKLITRINNSLKSSNTTTQVDESFQTIVRKLQGRRASAKPTAEELKTLEAEGKEVNQISVAQLSYDSKIDNLDKLIVFLASVPLYSPNEEDLKIESLRTLYTQLKAKNLDVATASIQLSNARIARNEILYKPLTGLVDIAFDTKTYVKSLFGTTSPYFKQISKLEFAARY